MRIPLKSVSSPSVRPAFSFQKIAGTITMETSAAVSSEQTAQLKEVVDQYRPVLDTLGAVPMILYSQ